MVPPVIYYLSLKSETPKKDYWDFGLLYDILENFSYFKSMEVDSLPSGEFGIVVIPARHHSKMVKEINQELSKLTGVILFLMGDEESDFPVEEITHPNIRIWVQNPKPSRHNTYRKLGTGYPPQIHRFKPELPLKDKDVFFAGQITHSRRREMAVQMHSLSNSMYYPSEGFTQGLDHHLYYEYMASAKIAPCPSGPITPDTFRLFEALELGCIPIADTQTPSDDWKGFWEWLFGEPVPFAQIINWASLPGYVRELKEKYPYLNNRVQAWWIRYKRKLKCQLTEDLVSIGAKMETNLITVVIPVSPIPSHPDTHILDETIRSIRHHIPGCEMILTFDGVRPEQENRRADYEEHMRRILWRYGWDITPFIFDDHKHQIGMMRAVIDEINTPLILYMEQDTPVVLDERIEWEKIMQKVLSGDSNMVRLHHEALILPEHTHLMLDKEPVNGFVRTAQWSQRPHVASTAFYRRMISENFSDKSKCFIEDLIHGKLHNSYLRDGEQGWNQWRVHIYHPEGQIKRSYTTDGRQGAEKYDSTQVW